MNKLWKIILAVLASLAVVAPADASLSLFRTFTGPGVDKSTDGCGSLTQTCTLTVNIPAGSTVLGVYLYSSLFSTATPGGMVTLGSTTVPYSGTPLGVNPANGILQAWRTDLSLSPLAAAFTTGLNILTVTETSSFQDGEAIVVVYGDPNMPVGTAFIFDGFSSSTGDSFGFSIPAYIASGEADMRIGDGFSFDGLSPSNPTSTTQVSNINVSTNTVASTLLTGVAGHCDDARDVSCANGNLITMGGDNDLSTPFPNPLVGQDHERYNLGNILAVGDTSLTIRTLNPSSDDNIFLAVFDFDGVAHVVPEPGSIALLGVALAGLGFSRRKRS